MVPVILVHHIIEIIRFKYTPGAPHRRRHHAVGCHSEIHCATYDTAESCTVFTLALAAPSLTSMSEQWNPSERRWGWVSDPEFAHPSAATVASFQGSPSVIHENEEPKRGVKRLTGAAGIDDMFDAGVPPVVQAIDTSYVRRGDGSIRPKRSGEAIRTLALHPQGQQGSEEAVA